MDSSDSKKEKGEIQLVRTSARIDTPVRELVHTFERFKVEKNHTQSTAIMADKRRKINILVPGLGIDFQQQQEHEHAGRHVQEDKLEKTPVSSTSVPTVEAQPSPSVYSDNSESSRSENYAFQTTLLAEIEEQLEDNYRAQSVSFVRATSSSSSKRSTPARTTPHESPLLADPASEVGVYPQPLPYTPTRIHGRASRRRLSSAAVQRSFSYNHIQSTTSVSGDTYILHPYRICSEGVLSPQPGASPSPRATSYGHQILQITTSPVHPSPLLVRRPSRARSLLYFTEEERAVIEDLVNRNPRPCEQHIDCQHCIDKEYAYHETRILPTSMTPEDRQRIINNNRALRNIKNELESLAEHGGISDEQYDLIMGALPNESPLSGAQPSRSSAASSRSPSAAQNTSGPPPAYNNGAPPPPPPRNPTPEKPEIARAIALYRYDQPGDCCFEVGDQIAILEYMNPEWSMGKNVRTGREGVFPMNYVQVQKAPSSNSPSFSQSSYGSDQKVNNGGYPAQRQYQQGPPPAPGPSNPYNSDVPPMQMANDSVDQGPSKGQEMGKKFGKKLGNAAVFGAGATIGSKIVNSIF